MVAIPGALLTHVPPVVGDTVVVKSTHMVDGPVNATGALIFTVTGGVGNEAQPVALLVNMNVAVPGVTAVTNPELSTVATALFVLCHVPPVFGCSWVVTPKQIELGPSILTTGLGCTVRFGVGKEEQPVDVWVKVKFTDPAATAVTRPELLTVAIDPLLLDHVPPVDGESWVVFPIHISVTVIPAVGRGVTVISMVF